MILKHATLLLVVLGITWLGFQFCACETGSSGYEQGHVATQRIQGSIRSGRNSKWIETVVDLKRRETMIDIQFPEASSGWIAGGSTVFRTSDGGKTWSSNEVSSQTSIRSYLDGISFLPSALGWAATGTRLSPLQYRTDQMWINHTSDGGKTWENQFAKYGSQISRLRFISSGEGWAVGRTRITNETIEDRPLILRTTDGGKTWIDLSEKFAGLNDFTVDVYAFDSSTAIVLTRMGQLFRTSDGGQTWKATSFSREEQTPVGMLRVGASDDKKLWVLEGTDGREGMWTTLALQRDGQEWVEYTTPSVYLKDVMFLSSQEVVACGSIANSQPTPSFDDRRDGVILHSTNGGRDWEILHRATGVSSINKLSAVSPGLVWAVGEHGLVLRFQYSP